jgi:hypothetical protein
VIGGTGVSVRKVKPDGKKRGKKEIPISEDPSSTVDISAGAMESVKKLKKRSRKYMNTYCGPQQILRIIRNAYKGRKRISFVTVIKNSLWRSFQLSIILRGRSSRVKAHQIKNLCSRE